MLSMTVFFCESLYCVIQTLCSVLKLSAWGKESVCRFAPEEGLLVWLLLLRLEFF